jgi:hypothetical protein
LRNEAGDGGWRFAAGELRLCAAVAESLVNSPARAAGATTPLGAEAAALYGLFVAHGHGALDFSGIIRFLRGT